MKKLLTLVLIMLVASPAFARGRLTNVFASWYTVGTTQTTISLPYNSRDITIINGDGTNPICVDLVGGTIPDNCVTDSVNNPSIFVLDTDTTLELSDFVTDSIALEIETLDDGSTASPVSVIVTY